MLKMTTYRLRIPWGYWMFYARQFHHWPDRMPRDSLKDVWETLSEQAKRVYRYSYSCKQGYGLGILVDAEVQGVDKAYQ